MHDNLEPSYYQYNKSWDQSNDVQAFNNSENEYNKKSLMIIEIQSF